MGRASDKRYPLDSIEDPTADSHSAARDGDGPAFLSPDTVAGIFRVDRKTIYGAIKTGALKALRLGRVLRIPAAAIEKLAGGAVAFTSGRRRRRPR